MAFQHSTWPPGKGEELDATKQEWGMQPPYNVLKQNRCIKLTEHPRSWLCVYYIGSQRVTKTNIAVSTPHSVCGRLPSRLLAYSITYRVRDPLAQEQQPSQLDTRGNGDSIKSRGEPLENQCRTSRSGGISTERGHQTAGNVGSRKQFSPFTRQGKRAGR